MEDTLLRIGNMLPNGYNLDKKENMFVKISIVNSDNQTFMTEAAKQGIY